MALSRRIIVSSILLLFAIPSQSQDFICPPFEEPAECPTDEEEHSLCSPEGSIGSDSGCPPSLMCCNTGCQFLDCVVPEMSLTRTQPQKVGTKVDPGDKNTSGPKGAPSLPQKAVTTQAPAEEPVCKKVANVFLKLKRQLRRLEKELKNLPK